MAQQLKKKFLGNDQVDGDKIKLEQGQSIKVIDSSNAVVDLIKLGASNEVIVNGDEVALKSNLDQEIIDRASGDASTLSSAQAYADQKIADLVDSAPALLDTLNELAAALGDDPNFVTTVTNLVAGVQSDIDQEILDRISGDSSTLSSANSYTDGEVSAEQSRAEAAESAIADDVSHLVTLSGMPVDSDNLGSFSGTTIADNQTIKQALQSLESAVESVSGGGSSTQSELDATQVGAGLETDGSYSPNPAMEFIGGAVSLKHADELLDDQMVVVSNAIDQEIQDRIADVDAEQSRAEAAEAALQGEIDTVESNLAQEILDRIADVNAEESRAIAAEGVLQSNIDAEESARISADNALDSRVDVLESVVWFKEKFTISNGQTFVTLSHTPEANSMSAFVDRLAIHQGAAEDYTISGTTMTFLNDIVSPGQSQLGNGDTVYVKYQYKV